MAAVSPEDAPNALMSRDNDTPSLLSAENIWYTIQTRKRGLKVILKDVSLDIESGKVLAIMGPSGAGKTMLLNCLTLQRGPGKRYGTVRLNGNVFTNSMFERHCSFVTQMDIQWTFLTCRQALFLVANLFAPPGAKAADKQAIVQDLCQKSGMMECLDTRIGNAFIPGLAFGQRRRLSLMIALLKQPLVVFLDEPTTNLDSASAAGIMKHLKVVASELKVIIVCTIHQPDRHVFDGFDSLLLMSDGQVAYNGSAASAEKHFSSLGKKVPPGVNPADFLLDLMNKSFTDPNVVDSLLLAWRTHTSAQKEHEQQKQRTIPAASPRKNALMQIAILFRRHLLLFIRDPSLYVGRVVMITISTVFLALCYIESRNSNQEQALNRMWLMLWIIGVPGNLSVVACFALNMEFLNVKFEVMSGMYKLYSYIIAHTLVQLPVMLLNAVCAISISGYLIGSWNGEQFVPMALTYALCFWSYECVAQACSVGKVNPLLGMMDFINYWFSSFLFCGFMLRSEDVIWPFRILVYILPMRYTIQACAYLEVKDVLWDGAVEDDSARGFHCPGKPQGVGCLGRTGEQVLDSLHQNFDVISSDTDTGLNLLLVFVMCLAFKLIYVATAYFRCRSITPPTPLSADVKDELLKHTESKVAQDSSAISLSHEESSRGAIVLPAKVGESRLVLTVENAWQFSGKKQNQKNLLEDVWLSVQSGEMLAMMGPSGAGKTLLLNLVSLVKGGPERYGTVKLNAVPFSSYTYLQYASQILQTDSHWPFLTPREELKIAVDFYSRGSALEKKNLVDNLLRNMGLENCQHTRLGNQFIPGCSGGQRRRASIVVAMAKNPLVLFLDEPTAGLDAAAALSIIKSIKEHALTKDIIVLCSLSQPSVEIFGMIDQLVLLSEGCVAYSGQANKAVQYFASIGQSLSTGDNPAEFLVSLLNRGFASSEIVDDVLTHWRQNKQKVWNSFDPNLATLKLPPTAKGPNVFRRMAYLLKRQMLLVARDPTMYSGRIIVNALSVGFFGLMYIESRKAVQEQVINRIFSLMWYCGVPPNLIVIAVFAHQEEISHVISENRSGMYGWFEYIISQFFLQILLLPLCTLSATAVAFVMGNWPTDHFLEFWLVYTLGYWVFESVGQCLAVRPLHVLLNMMDFVNFWFAGFLFCGLILPEADVIWPLRLMTYILPFKYWIRSAQWLSMTPQAYSGAEFSSSASMGFVCGSDVDPARCFGPTGCEALDTAGIIFDVLSCADKRADDMLYLSIMIAVYKIIFSMSLCVRCAGLSPLRALSDSKKNFSSHAVRPAEEVKDKPVGAMDAWK